jgi:hypothetical protein
LIGCSLLERMTAQAKELLKQNAKDNDAFGLLEDISGIRVALARDNEDRARWQNEYSAARARLATLPTENGGSGRTPGMSGSPDVSGTSAPGSSRLQTWLSKRLNRREAPPSDANPGARAERRRPASAGSAASMLIGSLLERPRKVDPLYPQTAKNMGVSGLVRSNW